MTTIEFGVFLNDVNEDRLTEAQGIARSLGVSINSDGSPFAGRGDEAPVKVVLSAPTVPSAEQVRLGRDRLDALLEDDERLTDYAVVKNQAGQVTHAISLLTAEVKPVAGPVAAPAAAPAAPARPRRWSPFR